MVSPAQTAPGYVDPALPLKSVGAPTRNSWFTLWQMKPRERTSSPSPLKVKDMPAMLWPRPFRGRNMAHTWLSLLLPKPHDTLTHDCARFFPLIHDAHNHWISAHALRFHHCLTMARARHSAPPAPQAWGIHLQLATLHSRSGRHFVA